MAILPFGGMLKVIAIYLVPIAGVYVAQHHRSVSSWSLRVGRRVHLVREPMPDPWGPPLENLAAKLRRLHPRVIAPREGMAMAKLRGIESAYDDALVDTARALGVETYLTDLPYGTRRAAERYRLEEELTEAGMSWQAQG